MKKILALVVALMLVLGMTTAFAATINAGNDTDGFSGTGPASITVTCPTYTDDEIAAGAVNTNTYKIYKVFDATVTADGSGISYTRMAGKSTVPAGFTADSNGYVTYSGTGTGGELAAADITAIKNYIAGDTPIAVVHTNNDASFTVTGLEYGYYFIDTTVGTLVTVNSTKPNASVTDKNAIPPLDKKITGASSIDAAGKKAIEEVGKDVEYTVTTTIQKGAENYIFYDKMDAGLAYNKDVKIYTENPAGKTGAAELANTYWTKDETATNDYTFKVTFDNEWQKANPNTDLWIVYSAKVTAEGLTVDPLKNTAHIEFGHNPGDHKTPYSGTKTYGAEINVVKNEEVPEGTAGATKIGDKWYKPLAGAGFVLKNSAGKYYQYHAAVAEPAADAYISWVDSIDDATEFTSQADGTLNGEFKGLAAGTYTLEEKTVPASYTKANDISVTIKPADNTDTDVFTAANLIQSRTVENIKGTALPSTGGMGTTLLYVGGSILVLAAVILLVTKRRMGAND